MKTANLTVSVDRPRHSILLDGLQSFPSHVKAYSFSDGEDHRYGCCCLKDGYLVL